MTVKTTIKSGKLVGHLMRDAIASSTSSRDTAAVITALITVTRSTDDPVHIHISTSSTRSVQDNKDVDIKCKCSNKDNTALRFTTTAARSLGSN